MSISKTLTDKNITPILMDIGAAGESPVIWAPLASASMLIGFEPDERNPDPSFGKGFAKALTVNKVVVPDDADEVEFILTKYPSCSSMLEPDLESLASFVFQDLFEPVKRIKLPSTSLDKVFEANDFGGANWIKIDAQGADLRILRSISEPFANHLLAVDIEPGFIDAYINEDLYPDCHAWLKDNGFWLSELKYQSYAKVRPGTVEKLEKMGFDRKQMLAKLTKSPTAAEARYLREVVWFEKNQEDQNMWLCGIAFGLATQQTGYVFDLLDAYDAKFGSDDTVAEFRAQAMDQIKAVLK